MVARSRRARDRRLGFIVFWGRKSRADRLGFVADFCPICRGIRPHRVLSISMVGHIYYISLGKGQIVGYKAKCLDCGRERAVHPGVYSGFAATPNTDTESLVAQTFPEAKQVYGERLALEAGLTRSGESSVGQQREALILEPFVAVAPMVEARSATQFDRASGLSCALTFAVPLALLVGAAATSSGGPQSALLKASLGAFAAGVVVTTVLLIAGPGRYVRHSVLPMLAHALHPLKPTERELSAALDRMSSLGLKVGRRVKPEQILSALAKFDDGQFRHPSVT